MEPVLSLCIPTYNRAPLLRQALQQIAGQWTKEFEGRLEIVVSDNASTDDTPQVLAQIAGEHAYLPLNVYQAPENRGPDANIYQAVRMARGVFVYILSDDDFLLPGALEKLFHLIREFPELDGFSLNIRSFQGSPDEVAPCWVSISEDTIVRDCNEALLLLNPLFLSVFAFRRALVVDRDYSATIGTNLLQSYLFLDVMAHGNGILVTAAPFLAQRQGNTSGWDFFPVMTTNLRDWLTRAEQIGYSSAASSAFLSRHLRTQILTAIFGFKLGGRASKLGPETRAYWDGMRRLWRVYGPEPFLLFIIFPLMLVPGGLLRLARDFYHALRPRRPIPPAPAGEVGRVS